MHNMVLATHTVNSFHYVADLVRVEHIDVGLYFDGIIKIPMDASGMSLITDSMKKIPRFSRRPIRLIRGNVMRTIRETLPKN